MKKSLLLLEPPLSLNDLRSVSNLQFNTGVLLEHSEMLSEELKSTQLVMKSNRDAVLSSYQEICTMMAHHFSLSVIHGGAFGARYPIPELGFGTQQGG